LTPVQPLSLCEAVTIATAGTSSANCAKYAIGVIASPISCTSTPDAINPAISAYLIEAEYERKSWPTTMLLGTSSSPSNLPRPRPSA
jgi:hypothetical protein